ncbi:MAG TPA: hypothetical protein ENN23_06285 [Deltaproteobacteria bacterium]|nr:hypothetical protein [Deltaproteobacteria bacterium]
MEYYSILNFKKEPFSNSPEPEFLFQSPQHTGCLQRLELAVRLRRGLNVVIGDIGTGKTTLCRKLLQNFTPGGAQQAEIESHLLLDPSFDSALEFLRTFSAMLGIKDARNEDSEWQLKERIKDYLFVKGVDEDKIVVLVIDEGQKISGECLEILREFLNYETNDYKLLQIIIFAQKEFKAALKKRPNLSDRIDVLYYLKPLNFKQMRAMIKYRLAVARNFEIAPSVFGYGAYVAIYLATGGYPRKVVSLCHEVILKMIIRNRHKAGWFLVRSCVNNMTVLFFRRLRWSVVSALILIALIFPVKALIHEYKTEAPANVPDVQVDAVTAQAEINILNSEQTDELSALDAPDAPVLEQEKRPEYKMPSYIGVLKIRKGMNLWWTLYNIYGETGHEIIDAVVEVNPEIRNRDLIEEGYFIALPAIPAQGTFLPEGKCIVLLKEGTNIETIYDFFTGLRKIRNMPDLIFLPHWSREENSVKYAVIIDRHFDSGSEAERTIKRLPPEIAKHTQIISQWNSDTVIFNRRALRT